MSAYVNIHLIGRAAQITVKPVQPAVPDGRIYVELATEEGGGDCTVFMSTDQATELADKLALAVLRFRPIPPEPVAAANEATG